LGKPFDVTRTGSVGDHTVMMPHFGVVLPLEGWMSLATRLEAAGMISLAGPLTRAIHLLGHSINERVPLSCDLLPRALEVAVACLLVHVSQFKSATFG